MWAARLVGVGVLPAALLGALAAMVLVVVQACGALLWRRALPSATAKLRSQRV